MLRIGLYPRALPPVTHGSALQAPERMRGIGAVIAIQAPECIRRPIRGRETINRTGNSPPGVAYRCGSRGAYFLLPTAAILFSGGLEGPARQAWELWHRAAAKTRLEQRPMTEGPRRNAS